MKELWKVIESFSAYEVSNIGRVRRIAGGEGAQAGRVLKQRTNASGYARVSLSIKGTVTTHTVHRLLAGAFIPNPEGLPDVNHKDGIKTHNEESNLEWRSRLGNLRHASEMGLNGIGVYFDKRRGKWMARYSPKPYGEVFIGYYTTKEEAITARKDALEALANTV